MRRWISAPFYGALLAPVWLLLRDASCGLLVALSIGAGLAVLARRLRT